MAGTEWNAAPPPQGLMLREAVFLGARSQVCLFV